MTARGWAAAALVAAGALVLPLWWNPALAYLNLLFMKVSLMAFGGAFTAIPLLQQEVVERFQWITTREFIDGIALGQITPGPIIITVTFVGYRLGGLPGALLGTIAALFPAYCVLVGALPHYDRIKHSRHIQAMVRGILAAFLGLLLFVAYRFAREALVDWRACALMAAAWIALWRKADLLLVIGAGAALSLVLF